MGLVLSQSAAVTGVGIVLGLGGTAALTKYLDQLLFGVTAGDPDVPRVPLFFLGPDGPVLRARGATRVDPLTALRLDYTSGQTRLHRRQLSDEVISSCSSIATLRRRSSALAARGGFAVVLRARGAAAFGLLRSARLGGALAAAAAALRLFGAGRRLLAVDDLPHFHFLHDVAIDDFRRRFLAGVSPCCPAPVARDSASTAGASSRPQPCALSATGASTTSRCRSCPKVGRCTSSSGSSAPVDGCMMLPGKNRITPWRSRSIRNSPSRWQARSRSTRLREAELALVERRIDVAQELLGLADVHRPARRVLRRLEEPPHLADAVGHARLATRRRVAGRPAAARASAGRVARRRVRRFRRGPRRAVRPCADRRCADGRRRRRAPRARCGPSRAAHVPGGGELLREVAEAAHAVGALGERRVELQQRALQQAELRRDLAIAQHLERAPHQRHHLIDRRLRADTGPLLAAAIAAHAASRPGSRRR